MGHIDDQNEDTFENWGELESRFEKKEWTAKQFMDKVCGDNEEMRKMYGLLE